MEVNEAMRQIRDADDEFPTETDDRDQQYEMYEKTLETVKNIDADDDDEGVVVVTGWIVEELNSTGERPSSRAVRSRAKKFCRNQGYEVANDSWMG